MTRIRNAFLAASVALAAVSAFTPSAHASSKLIYQTPPEGILLTSDNPNPLVKTLTVSSYNAVRVAATVRGLSSGTGKVSIELSHADPFLSPYTGTPTIEFPMGGTKDMTRGSSSSTVFERPGVKLNLRLLNKTPSQGETYTVDIAVYGGT